MQRCLVLAESSANLDIQEEALWALANAVTSGSPDTVREAFLHDFTDSESTHGRVVFVFLKGLHVKTSRLVLNLIESLHKLL